MAPRLCAGLAGSGIALGLLCGTALPAWAAGGPQAAGNTAPEASGALFDFDIPAQPLAAALDHYAATARLSIVVASDMVRGRASAAVHGRLPPGEALRRLLAGTGLVAEQRDAAAGAVYLLAQAVRPAPPRAGLATLYGQSGYAGLLQSRIWQALCADTHTAPGRYRLLFQFQVDAAGQVSDPELLLSTGDAARDAGVLRALRALRVAPPPPPLVRQSLLMSLLPGQAGAACGAQVS